MNIRRARPEDAQLILDLVMALAIYEKAPEEVRATVADVERDFFTDNPQVRCDFVELDGQVVGFVVWFLNYSTWTGTHGIYIEDLFVLPEHRGNGYGKALLTHLANLCVTRGYHRLQWWVLNWNEPSIEFYKSLGAKPMNEWTVMRVDGEALTKLAQDEK
jgi:GNAT superfamily N-acetyltransferase